MRYFIICLFLIVNIIYAKTENVEITSKNFEANEAKMISNFSGNVVVTKGYDAIHANKLTIYFDKKKNPIKYIATGNTKFKLMLNKKHYAGYANKIIYNPIKEIYHFIGNVFLQDVDSDKKIYGEDIKIDQKNGKYSVNSDGRKPVKFIFKVKDKNSD